MAKEKGMAVKKKLQDCLTLVSRGKTTKVDLYSPEGMDLVSKLWIKLSAEYKLMYQLSWMGIPIIQFPEDVCMMQELIWKLRPDVIVECGIAHGGSLVFYASLLELIGKGRIIGVDVEIRQHNRVAISNHMMSPRIDLIEGSSVDPKVIDRVRKKVQGARTVLVLLDSNHSAEHVAKELAMYSDLVTPGSYLVAMDGAQAWVWDIPRGKSEWKNDNPLTAIEHFLAKNDRFVMDEQYTRLKITSNPGGYLRRLTPEEVAR